MHKVSLVSLQVVFLAQDCIGWIASKYYDKHCSYLNYSPPPLAAQLGF